MTCPFVENGLFFFKISVINLVEKVIMVCMREMADKN